jgi:myo-inositol 2-dehydrogenase/D-chiro-inositol 1-dehydrogenase
MNILILGEGPAEEAWAHALVDHPEHRLWAACPGLKSFPNLPGGRDLDDALATAGVEAVIVGGEPELRAEGLRRAAAAGLPVICLHPPGPNADPYYQIALSRQETGAIVVPDIPARLHPGLEAIAKALRQGSVGAFRELRYELPIEPSAGNDLIGEHFPRVVDVVRRLIGEIEATTATGDPPGPNPTQSLVVQLRGPEGRRAEVRLIADSRETAHLTLNGTDGAISLEHDPSFLGTSRLIVRTAGANPSTEVLEPWNPHTAILDVLTLAVRTGDVPHPNLFDGTRAMEVAEATARSLRRGRTVDMFYEEMSEEGNFKSVMTGIGCAMLLGALGLYCVALAAWAFGYRWSVYLAWAIPPLLFVFLVLQLFRFAIRKR